MLVGRYLDIGESLKLVEFLSKPVNKILRKISQGLNIHDPRPILWKGASLLYVDVG